MNIDIQQHVGKVPVTVVSMQGDLDGSNYTELIRAVESLCQSGATRDLVLDLSGVRYMSSAGIVALHTIALLMRGEPPPDPEQGWAALHAVANEAGGRQEHVKLLNPQARVAKTLEMAGLKEYFEVHSDLTAALASF
jgi:anti-anti-sigma regulatory factor